MLDTRVRFYARTPTALFQKMTPPTAQRPPSTLSVNTYARRCVYVGVYVGAHARKLRARATRIVYIGSILSPPRSFNSSCLSNDCYFLSSPSRYDPSLPISSLVPQEQDFSIYHSSVIPFEQRTLGFLFLRRNDDTDREIRGD